MKTVILKDATNIHEVYLVNIITDDEVELLQGVAHKYNQEIVVKDTTEVRGVGDIFEGIIGHNTEGTGENHE